MKKISINILFVFVGAILGIAGVRRKMKAKVTCEKKMSEKHLALYLMMNQWVKVKQEGKKLSSYFEKRNYHEIAVYGMSFAGKTLVDELEGSGIKIKYGIDKKADNIYAEFEVVTPDEKLEEVDAVVVTAIQFFSEIEEKLSKKIKCPIISLENVLYEV